MDQHRRQTTQEHVVTLLSQTGALLTGRHIVYSKGGHGTDYVDIRAALPHTRVVRQFGEYMAELLADDRIDAVIGPAMGAVTLAYAVADVLTSRNERVVSALFAEKDECGAFTKLRAEFLPHLKDQRVAIVEDVWTTGGSTAEVAKLVAAHGGTVVAAVAVWNRMETSAEKIGVPRIEALVNRAIVSYPEAECPLFVERGIEIDTSIGHGKKYLTDHPDGRCARAPAH